MYHGYNQIKQFNQTNKDTKWDSLKTFCNSLTYFSVQQLFSWFL